MSYKSYIGKEEKKDLRKLTEKRKYKPGGIETPFIVETSNNNSQRILRAFDRINVGASVGSGTEINGKRYGLITIYPENRKEMIKSKEILYRWYQNKKIAFINGSLIGWDF